MRCAPPMTASWWACAPGSWIVPALTTRLVPGRSPSAIHVLTSGNSPKPEKAPSGEVGATLVVPTPTTSQPVLDAWRQAGYEVLGMEGHLLSQGWWTEFKAQTGMSTPAWLKAERERGKACWCSPFGTRCHVLTRPPPLGSGLKAPVWPSGHPARVPSPGAKTCCTRFGRAKRPAPC